MTESLPIFGLKEAFLTLKTDERVVVSAPTGSGKSTMIPQWSNVWGKVLVIEPRRVACRGLASRVAELQGTSLGDSVGYIVKDDNQSQRNTQILFVTSGIALKMLAADQTNAFATIILDEFHERSLDLDLLLALLLLRFKGRLVIMSATIAGAKVAAHIHGKQLIGEGRVHPVHIQYIAGKTTLPDVLNLERRLDEALKQLPEDEGDVLIFMPGKAEIQRTMEHIQRTVKGVVLGLHGGLTLREQSQIFKKSTKRRFIVATNVAETSITIPNVTVVIDSGLVRRTQYHQGRGYLTLAAIAQDSADQRAGRAGRVRPGDCFRLWAPHGGLEVTTTPEIHREALEGLVLAAAACSMDVQDLPFLDPPKGFALDAARKELILLGAFTESFGLTPRGRTLFALPIDPRLGRLLQEAEVQGTLSDVLPLVAALSTTRPIFKTIRPEHPDDDLKHKGCDAVALIEAVRRGDSSLNHLNAAALRDARNTLKRLQKDWFPTVQTSQHASIQMGPLALTLLNAWPDAAYIIRRRKRQVAWSNGGTEVALQESSAVDPNEASYLIALDSRAIGMTKLKRTVVITQAMVAKKQWFIDAQLGDRIDSDALIEDNKVWTVVDIQYANVTLATQRVPAEGNAARAAFTTLFLKGSLFPKVLRKTRERLETRRLWERLQGLPLETLPLDEWVANRVETLGVESGSDLALLSPSDFLANELPTHAQQRLDRAFPRQLKIGGSSYRIEYDVRKREVLLHRLGHADKQAPSMQYLPNFKGWRVIFQNKNARQILRDRN